MDYFEKKQWIRIAICVVLVAAIALGMTGAFSGGKQLEYQDKSAHPQDEAENSDELYEELAQAIVQSLGREHENSYVTDYLSQDSYLVDIYEGFGFAKEYGSARGHAYTLEDVQKTARPHAKANCLTCKTPDMHKMIAEQGVGVYSMPFDEVMAQTSNTVSCYNCHGDDSGNNGQMVVTHQYVNEALGENVSTINAASLSCGQCHIEYYFTPEDSETMMPYHSIEEMTPEAILAYYDGIGFSDWEQPGTGTKMLKAQHPELETYLQGRHASILSCADCHMAEATTESGKEYHDHHVVSPLSSEAILNKCAECHGSGAAISARVREIQAKVTGRETQVGTRLASFKDTFATAAEAGKLDAEQLEAVRKLHREAQWYFDFCYVENSEGAHNSSLAMECLDTADEKLTEAFGLLADAGVEVGQEALSSGKTEEAEPQAADGNVTEKGFGGDVTVHLEINDDGTVKAVTIDTPNETEGLGKRASEAEFTEQFIGKMPPFTFGENGIEALSGATVTSTAALTAINKAAATPAAGETVKDSTGEETVSDNNVTERGFGGDITVHLEINDDGTVKSLSIDTPNETDGLGKRASDAEFTDQFIGKAGPFAFGENGIEALSGATVTSTAALTAINKAVSGEAAADTPAEEKTEEPAEEKNEEPEVAEEPKEETKTEEPKSEEKAESAASDGQIYGSYRVTKENQFSKVTVTAGTKNGVMTSCRIASEGEQDLLTDEIRDEWANAILKSGSATPDAITGASLSFSAQSVQDAVTEILEQINSGAAVQVETTEKTEEPEEEKAEETKTEEKAEAGVSDGQVYGSYRVTKENQFSKITVTAGTKNGVMTSCRIASEGEQDLLTDEIRDEWAKAILESGTATPDAITGASLTFSAQSVQEAVTDILAQMNGEAPASAESEKKTEAEPEPAEAPAEEPAEVPAEELTETSAEETTEVQAEELTETPAEEQAEAPAEAPKEETSTEKAYPAYAGYRADQENDFSKVTVIAAAKSGKLTSVKILSSGDKDLLTDEIRDEWAKAILESGSAAPDAITGASLTFSAQSVQDAVTEILAKIDGE